jgi:hypothetical protein
MRTKDVGKVANVPYVAEFSCEKNLFQFPLHTAKLKRDFFYNRECAANCSGRGTVSRDRFKIF